MEHFFLNMGFSWTMAKVSPYVLMVVIGIILMAIFKKRSIILRLLLLPIPFGVYFYFSPIYQGDFSNSFEEIKLAESDPFVDQELSLVAIAGCPYCYEAIDQLSILKERNSNLGITFYVYTNDSTNLDWYKEKGGDWLSVKQIPLSNSRISEITNGSYPTFIFRTGSELKTWSNDSFGVRAKDYVELKSN